MDLSVAIKLKDSKEKIDIEKPFKLVAGPGAGKTTFLVNHIKNILNNSSRLSKARKIACITYTNVGVDTIINRLNGALDNVEVGTIHNFLYSNVVKPYLWVLDSEFSFDYKNIDGHDEVIPGHKILDEWRNNTNQKYLIKYDKKLIKAFSHLKWIYKEENIKLEFSNVYDSKIEDNISIRRNSLLEYKKICWSQGLISHDDVLFLSYKIILKQPRVLEILRAKYPYLIIDEFQDTNPIQTYIVNKIAEKETVVGVIGDEWQSIYEFQGANLEDFENFSVENIQLYKLENNHRSTQQIIDVLNDIRNEKDFLQISPEVKIGDKPYIITGSFFDAYEKASEICNGEDLFTLTYVNKMSNILKYNYEDKGYESPEDLINELRTFDGDRGKLILNVIYSIEYCRQNRIKEAIKYMKKAYRKVSTLDDFSEREALKIMSKILSNYDSFSKQNIKDFYLNNIHKVYNKASKIQGGQKAEFYTNLLYKNVALAIKLDNDDNSKYKTIHKSKGDEYDNVLVVISDRYDRERARNLEFLLNPDKNDEQDRLYYVALSRAKKRLFINVPSLSKKDKVNLGRFNIV